MSPAIEAVTGMLKEVALEVLVEESLYIRQPLSSTSLRMYRGKKRGYIHRHQKCYAQNLKTAVWPQAHYSA